MIDIPLHRESSLPMYRQIAEHLRRMILSGALPGGFRLPGTRSLAEAHGISRNTVAEAYALLQEEELVFTKNRSGMYVQEMGGKKISVGPSRKYMDFATDLPSPELLPVSLVRSLLREEMQRSCSALLASPVSGFLELRKALTRHAAGRGIPASWKEVLVTSGVQEGLALSLEVFRSLGVRRLCAEELTYPHILGMGQSRGFSPAILPRNWSAWEKTLQTLGREDALFLVPSFQNPTGRTLPMEMRKELLEASQKNGFWIIEDDAYGELRYGESSVPALKAMRGADRVIYCGSFSQLLFPGLRIGYMLLPENLWKECCRCKMRNTGYSSALSQKTVFRFLEENYLEEVLLRVRSEMKERMVLLGNLLREIISPLNLEIPGGGIYLWVPAPEGSGMDLEKKARSRGILLQGGERFYAGKEKRRVGYVRFSVSRMEREEILSSSENLKELWGCATS
ncbi:MAG TPA: PLP-dependent aminotransferase family protein [Synergistaceae bacterium]|nr:PLP-dependent aminotransferase family protein [Synergistaceae bacterium]